MKERLKTYWKAFANIATIFSFTVNFILVMALILSIGLIRDLLGNLDNAFLGLGQTNVRTLVTVGEEIPIHFDQGLNQPLDLDFPLPINQNTVVVLTEPVPLSAPTQFILPGFGGAINGTVNLSLPPGMRLPIRLDMVVPVSRTIDIELTVPVSQSVPIAMEIPVDIQLGTSGLNPAVEALRGVFEPYIALIDYGQRLISILKPSD